MTKATDAAKALLAEFWDNVVPVNLDLFLKPLGLKVVEIDDMATESGQLSGDVIYVKKTDADYRKRFTIAHEIGHAYLGHGDRYRNTVARVYSSEEADANAFAAELLMPTVAVRVLIEIDNLSDPAELRELFNVSAESMRYRLQHLGYIKE